MIPVDFILITVLVAAVAYITGQRAGGYELDKRTAERDRARARAKRAQDALDYKIVDATGMLPSTSTHEIVEDAHLPDDVEEWVAKHEGFSVEVVGLDNDEANRVLDVLETNGYTPGQVEVWGTDPDKDFVRTGTGE